MILNAILLLIFFIAFPSSATDTITTSTGTSDTIDPKIRDQIITLNVGGKEFLVCRSTLCKYSGMFERMFATDSQMNPSVKTATGAYFVDGDPLDFKHILFFLRHNRVRFKNVKEAEETKASADVFCPAMIPQIDYWITKKKCERAKRARLSVGPRMTESNNKVSWFLYKNRQGQIIGSKQYGHAEKALAEKSIEEYKGRMHFLDLVYAWSGRGLYPYNLHSGKRIGEYYDEWQKHEYLSAGNKVRGLDLISNAQFETPDRYYICSFNELGTFSIFHAITGEKMLSDLSFASLRDCVNNMGHQVAKGKI
jgi:hypothetical protein